MIHTLNPIPPNRNQKPNLCAATCLQMILDRRGIEYGPSLEALAIELGLYIDERDKDMFGAALKKRTLKHGDARIGLLFDDFKKPEKLEQLKELFGLEAKTYHPSEIGGTKGIKELLTDSFGQGKDVIINYRLELFNGREDGHYVLAFAFDDENNDVYVSDPSPFIQEYWKVRMGRFAKAMQPIWTEDDGKQRERGLIVLHGPMHKKRIPQREMDNYLKNTEDYVAVDVRIQRNTPSPQPYHVPKQIEPPKATR